MVVVSAGVIMNLMTAIVMFVIAFMVGVGSNRRSSGRRGLPCRPGDRTRRGTGPRIARPPSGDRVASIDGDTDLTFSDVMIESAMSVPGRPLASRSHDRASTFR